MTTHTKQIVQELPPHLAVAVAPLVRWAFGVAIGSALGTILFAIACYRTFAFPDEADGLIVGLLGYNFMPGYAATVPGAFVGLFWGLVWGFVLGWLFAFARNRLAVSFVLLGAWRAKAEADRQILDDLI